MSLSPGMADALEGVSALAFVAVEITFPAATLRLLDGPGVVVIDGHVFTGADATLGALGGIEVLSDGLGGEAPALQLVINPPTNAASADLASPAAQGSPVKVWIGVLDPADGAVLGDPYLLFLGEVDQGVLRAGKGTRTLSINCVSAWERFFDNDEGIRLNHAWQLSVWPGENGLEFVTEIGRQLPWGADAPRPDVVTDLTRLTGPAAPVDPTLFDYS